MGINKQSKTNQSDNLIRPIFNPTIDPYKSNKKLSEPATCKHCGAVYHDGHWQWSATHDDASEEICPACLRIQDNQPAGYITMEGSFFNAKKDEIIRLVNNHYDHERTEHPLKRIIQFEDKNDSLMITTTDTHLAYGIAHAVHNAYQGELNISHPPGEYMVRIRWIR